MNHPEKKALEIATQLVTAKLSNSTSSVSADAGKNVAEYFKAIYTGVKEIADNLTD